MQLRVVAPVLLAVAAVFGLIFGAVLPTGSGSSSASSSSAAPSDAASAGSTGNAAIDPGANNGSVADTNAPQPEFEVTKIASADEAPQFVVVSFDGACKDDLFKHYLDTAERNNARFTFFLSGLCILPDAKRFEYKPPLKPAGSSAIGFGEASYIPDRIRNMTTAYERGHEIGTHALGHFCGKGGVGDWSAADWKSELSQFNEFVDNWRSNLPTSLSEGVPALPFNSSVVKGIRTPCLEGKRSAMLPVFKDFGYTYNASDSGELAWPGKDKVGLWDFPLQTIKVIGYGKRSNLSMDYNFLCTQNDCSFKATQAQSDKIEQSTKDSFDAALKAVCTGNRAPFFIGNHFNNWANSAYKNSLTAFIDGAKDVCPDVQFITNADLVKWMNAQDPAVLKELRARGSQSY